ncbi:hypothetical protein VB712_16095 [Spirulina sp. CCNP1310]|uniref:hypothetical protein n=1 Tax=Spirulina sp. CCNP1310 TaxID=3110249 RepID=UPI002B218ED6|nr:hypothetical protein [Spirulina sp. CCNP1310]MEA5420754.1 hypothetical protein [Spirulina sp. CCNP1310]
MADWVKIPEHRQIYLVDLEQITAFIHGRNGRLSFWLPNSAIPIVLTQASNPDTYARIAAYTEHLLNTTEPQQWFNLDYDRSTYVVNLARVSSFCYGPGRKVTFWLPDAGLPVILTPQSNGPDYQAVCDFVEGYTGYVLGAEEG